MTEWGALRKQLCSDHDRLSSSFLWKLDFHDTETAQQSRLQHSKLYCLCADNKLLMLSVWKDRFRELHHIYRDAVRTLTGEPAIVLDPLRRLQVRVHKTARRKMAFRSPAAPPASTSAAVNQRMMCGLVCACMSTMINPSSVRNGNNLCAYM